MPANAEPPAFPDPAAPGPSIDWTSSAPLWGPSDEDTPVPTPGWDAGAPEAVEPDLGGPDDPAAPDDAGDGESGGIDALGDLFGDDDIFGDDLGDALDDAADFADAGPEPSTPVAGSPFAAAPVTPPAPPQPGPPSRPVGQARRWDRFEQLYAGVDALMAVISSDQVLSGRLQSLVLTRDPELDTAQQRQFRDLCEPALAAAGRLVISNPQDIHDVFSLAYDELIGLGPLGELWRDDEVTEILVDNPTTVYVERAGHIESSEVRFRSLDHAQALARTMSAKVSDRTVSPANPLVTAELPGARVTFCYGAVVRSGVSITIRKFRPLMGMAELLAIGALDEHMRDFLVDCVRARATVLVSGGTGTGKTTMINALSESIGPDERIVTIEDAFELTLASRYVVSLQTKERASLDDAVHVTQADLLVNALRMRPDRVVVGEIRDPEGAKVMLQAANTGHDGSLTTIHANTPEAALNFRMAGLLRSSMAGMSDDVAIREVANAIDLVVQVTRRGGVRFISEIAVVDTSDIRRGEGLLPTAVFTGNVTRSGRPEFHRVGGVRSDTVLAVKLAEAGIDPQRWEVTP